MARLSSLILFLPYLAAFVVLAGNANPEIIAAMKPTVTGAMAQHLSLRATNGGIAQTSNKSTKRRHLNAPTSSSDDAARTQVALAHSVDSVVAAVNELADALLVYDLQTLGAMLTADYTHIDGEAGRVFNKSAWLSWMASERQALLDNTLRIAEYRIDELTVQRGDDVAFVTGIVTTSGVRNGEPFARTVRFSNVWVERHGRWLRATFHDTSVSG